MVLKGVEIGVATSDSTHLHLKAAHQGAGKLPHTRSLVNSLDLGRVGKPLGHLDVLLDSFYQGVDNVLWDVVPHRTILAKLGVPA